MDKQPKSKYISTTEGNIQNTVAQDSMWTITLGWDLPWDHLVMKATSSQI